MTIRAEGPERTRSDSEELEALAATWNHEAGRDAMWAVLTRPGKPWTTEEFLATGRHELATVFEWLDSIDVQIGNQRALDFGCGVGRLTQAMASRFATAVGVDIAEAMIDAARKLDPPPGCEYRHNAAPDLSVFGDGEFDFVYSNLVLQHMPSPMALGYLGEFVRVLRPGGVAIAGMTERGAPAPALSRARHKLRRVVERARSVHRSGGVEKMQMNVVDEAEVQRAVAEAGATILAAPFSNTPDAGFSGDLRLSDQRPAGRFCGRMYAIRRS